jgi:hypothetical protein
LRKSPIVVPFRFFSGAGHIRDAVAETWFRAEITSDLSAMVVEFPLVQTGGLQRYSGAKVVRDLLAAERAAFFRRTSFSCRTRFITKLFLLELLQLGIFGSSFI